MKERPILFSAPMVRAVLAGTKTQTRRVVKGWHGYIAGREEDHDDPANWGGWHDDGYGRWAVLARGLDQRHQHGKVSVPCPYGMPGDRLWVREAWALWYGAGGPGGESVGVRYFADGATRAVDPSQWSAIKGHAHREDSPTYAKYKPSIHMPRWASRISLEITGVRVERARDISDADAMAEGIRAWTKDGTLQKYAPADDEGDWTCWPWADTPRTPRAAFERLWREINGVESWAANPWLWVIEFRRVDAGRTVHDDPT